MGLRMPNMFVVMIVNFQVWDKFYHHNPIKFFMYSNFDNDLNTIQTICYGNILQGFPLQSS